MFRAKGIVWFLSALSFAAIAHAQDPAPLPAYRIGGGVTQPQLLHKIEPAYTEEARRAGIEGTVELAIVVDKDGSVRAPRVTKSVDSGLDAMAIQAVKQWMFKPGQKDGVPVRATLQQQLDSALDQQVWKAFDRNLIAADLQQLKNELIQSYTARFMSGYKKAAAEAYAETFPLEELHDLTGFYKTPLGELLARKTPELTARSLSATRPLTAEIVQERQKMIQEWIEAMKKKYATQ